MVASIHVMLMLIIFKRIYDHQLPTTANITIGQATLTILPKTVQLHYPSDVTFPGIEHTSILEIPNMVLSL